MFLAFIRIVVFFTSSLGVWIRPRIPFEGEEVMVDTNLGSVDAMTLRMMDCRFTVGVLASRRKGNRVRLEFIDGQVRAAGEASRLQ